MPSRCQNRVRIGVAGIDVPACSVQLHKIRKHRTAIFPIEKGAEDHFPKFGCLGLLRSIGTHVFVINDLKSLCFYSEGHDVIWIQRSNAGHDFHHVSGNINVVFLGTYVSGVQLEGKRFRTAGRFGSETRIRDALFLPLSARGIKPFPHFPRGWTMDPDNCPDIHDLRARDLVLISE